MTFSDIQHLLEFFLLKMTSNDTFYLILFLKWHRTKCFTWSITYVLMYFNPIITPFIYRYSLTGCIDEQGHCRNESEIWMVSTGVTCYQKRCVRTDTGTKVKFEIKLHYRGNISIYNNIIILLLLFLLLFFIIIISL